MNIVSWLIFGLLVGIIAQYIDREHATWENFSSTTVLAMLGAVLGGFLGDLLFGLPERGLVAGFNLSSLMIAAIGALIIVFVGRIFTRSI